MQEIKLVIDDDCFPRTFHIYPEIKKYDQQTNGIKLKLHSSENGITKMCMSPFSATTANETFLLHSKFINKRIINGIIGVLNLVDDDYLGVITNCTPAGFFMQKAIFKVTGVAFFSLTTSKFDKLWSGSEIPGLMPDGSPSEDAESLMMHPIKEIAKYFCNGMFYFSTEIDLSASLDDFLCTETSGRPENASMPHKSSDHCSFVWNYHMLQPFITFEKQNILLFEDGRSKLWTNLIQGFFSAASLGIQKKSRLGIISKLSWKRVGTRFNSRGVDDDGNVSNFVLSEIFLDFGPVFTYKILRGSVPVYWEQNGLQLVEHKLQINRSFESTAAAFSNHFEGLGKHYGNICVIDLLNQRNGNEAELSEIYKKHVTFYNSCNSHYLNFIRFDFNAICKSNSERISSLLKYTEKVTHSIGFSFLDPAKDSVFCKQIGIHRVNCLDCLDRTNVIQSHIAFDALSSFLRQANSSIGVSERELLSVSNELWKNNGDAISLLYAGTGALKSSYSKNSKRTIFSMFDDMAKSAQRFLINNFQDKDRQQLIDLVLGKYPTQNKIILYDPFSEKIESQLSKEQHKFTEERSLVINCVTWNVGGDEPKQDDTFCELFASEDDTCPDLVVVCLQEMVPLTAAQVMASEDNKEKRRAWERALDLSLKKVHDGRWSSLQLIISHQMVGTLLIIWTRIEILPFIKNIETATKKTGMAGITGNKGGIACRFDLYNSSVCFVGAHFAAGQDSVDARRSNYWTIWDDLVFSYGKKIQNHENIFWMGDLNYRIDLDFKSCASLIAKREFARLWEYDQLLNELKEGRVFIGFKEGPLSFYPTYKFRINENSYECGEKMRTPSWTDRIFYAGGAKQLWYQSVQSIKFSDHRPVISQFKVPIKVVDVTSRSQIEESIISALTKCEIRNETVIAKISISNEQDLIEFE